MAIAPAPITYRQKYEALAQRPAVREMFAFLVVGILGFALWLAVQHIASTLLFRYLDAGQSNTRLIGSYCVAFVITLTFNFFMNARFTFRSHPAQGATYLRYGLVTLSGQGVNVGFSLLFTRALAGMRGETLDQLHLHFQAGETIGCLCAGVIVMVWNYSLSKFWAFRPPKGPAEIVPLPTASPVPTPVALPQSGVTVRSDLQGHL